MAKNDWMAPMKTTRRSVARLRRRSERARGGCCMTPGSGCSVPSASPGSTSEPRSMASTCRAPSGTRPTPPRAANTNGKSSAMLCEKM